MNLWLKATFRLIELLPTHPAVAPIFAAPAASVTPAQQQASKTTTAQPSSSTPSSTSQPTSAAGDTTNKGGDQEPTVLVTNPVYRVTSGPLWTNLGLGAAGVAVVGLLVYRLVGSSNWGARWFRLSRVKSGTASGSRGGLQLV